MNPTSRPYRFLAFDISLFSAKVRPALRYKQLWYEEERADLGEIQKRTGLGFMPIVITPDDETWQDSTDIYERLEARHPEPPLFPRTPLQRLTAHLIELYHDEFSLLPAMHYRWGSRLGEATARARFSAMIGNRELGDFAADRMVKARRFVGATDDTATVTEAHTEDLLAALSAHFSANQYLLGDRMTFADCALMGTFYGHLFNDLVPRRLLLETAEPVVGWIERCNFPRAEKQGALLSDDALAPTLIDVLRVMGHDASPLIGAMADAIDQWADDNPGQWQQPPRMVGEVTADLRGTPVTRVAMPYTLKMIANACDAYQSMSSHDRTRADQELDNTGWVPLLQRPLRHRIVRKGFELTLE
ncbi:MAG: glutathione S-transferase [Hyphomicrobiaceae bacterium]|jgi:glutathione S-transferase